MKKKLLLTGLISLYSIGMANAICTSPATLKCQCQHPIINSEGKLACGTSYCGDKQCMPDGSCCETEKYCNSSGQGKQCCSTEQSCDTTKGCVEKKADIETLCSEAGGRILLESSGTFCFIYNEVNWDDAKELCQKYGMTMPTIYEMCPSWNGEPDLNACPEMGLFDGIVWSGTSVPDDTEKAFYVMVTQTIGTMKKSSGAFSTICH